MAIYQLDIRGEICPYPLIATKEKVAELQPGDRLEVWIDYPLALDNITRWAENAGHRVVTVERTGNPEWRLVIEVGPT
ncbi:MAG: sulfurtransferase TusA family protein [Candidatus Bipolaricaulia bacterium]